MTLAFLKKEKIKHYKVMSTELIKQQDSELVSKLVLEGDLSKMSPQQKVQYYNSFCNSLGLNPLTQPFQLITFQGKQRLYATKDCTEQLRKIHGVSITDISTVEVRGVFVVTAKAKDKEGKTDCSTGAVNVENLKGDALANALMKAETKAKRRVTLSICGLGILDESETDTMPGAKTADIEHEEIYSNGKNGYNHTALGTTAKPLISNLQFKNLCARVEKGDVEAYKKAKEHFTFLPDGKQERILEEIIASLIDKEPIANNLKPVA